MKDYKAELKADMDAFTADNQYFRSEFLKQNEMIRGYDAALCQKASKDKLTRIEDSLANFDTTYAA